MTVRKRVGLIKTKENKGKLGNPVKVRKLVKKPAFALEALTFPANTRRFDMQEYPHNSIDRRWEALVLTGYWYKGWGKTPQDAVNDLKQQLFLGKHLGK